VIAYGIVQSIAPAIIRGWTGGHAPQGRAAQVLAFLLAGVTTLVAVGLTTSLSPAVVILGGLGLFAIVFAVNSSVHSYLILAYSDGDAVATNVGFYYMANAGGRLAGTLLSGIVFQAAGVVGCLWVSAAFAAMAGVIALLLPHKETSLMMSEMKAEGGSD
jgi:predicted MFS family arabinose efflux permease